MQMSILLSEVYALLLFLSVSFTDEYIGDDFGNPTPCEGGGNGDGGIPG